MRLYLTATALLICAGSAAHAQNTASSPATSGPLVIGETFTIDSKVMHEVRRINVYKPPGYSDSSERVPVLYMPDGGMAEDFLHVAGLVQVGVGNGTMRPFLLVGIENTQRRRDTTGPTDNPEDRKIAPRVGGSALFREFIRKELMPLIKARYRTTNETAIVGDRLPGFLSSRHFCVSRTCSIRTSHSIRACGGTTESS
jgi:predicted alpha/beta superfamily hydrolase